MRLYVPQHGRTKPQKPISWKKPPILGLILNPASDDPASTE